MTESPSVLPNFATPPGQPVGGQATPKMPGPLLAFCIVFLILGLLGFGAGAVGMLSGVFQFFVMNSLPSSNPQAAPVLAMQKATLLPNLAMGAINLLVCPTLIAGAIGVLCSKRWGISFLRWSLFAAMGSVVINTILMTYTQLISTNAMTNQIASSGGPQELATFMGSFVYIWIAIWSVKSLSLLVVYTAGYMYLGSKQTRQYCRTFK